MTYETAEKILPTIDRESMVRAILQEHINTGLNGVPDVVIFDISNTLVDSKTVEIEALNFVLLKFGKQTWEGGTRKLKDPLKSIKQNFPNFFGENWEIAYDLYIRYMLDRKERTPLIEGARELLSYLHENGIKVIIVSNRDRAFSEELMSYHGVSKFITSIIGADDTPYAKPDPRMVECILSRLGCTTKTSNVVFVGDALVDVQCADASGCQPVLVKKYITDITTDFIVGRIKESHGKMYDLQSVQNHFGIIELVKISKTRWFMLGVDTSTPKIEPQRRDVGIL